MFGESAQARANKQKPQHGLSSLCSGYFYSNGSANVCLYPRYGMLLGSRATLLAPSRRLLHAGGLRRRLHTEPQLPRGLLRYGPLAHMHALSTRMCFEAMARAHPARRRSGLPGCPPPPLHPHIRSVRVQGDKKMQRLGGGGWSGGDV